MNWTNAKNELLLSNCSEFMDFVGRPEVGEICGVHCAHGVNRTGYFVCRYLMKIYGMSADAAIALFEQNRGHKIEKEELLNALHAYSTSN